MEKIEKIVAREILDSRGNPTVEAEVILSGGAVGVGKVPSGASTGEAEALELSDGEERYFGKGKRKVVEKINGEICRALQGKNVEDIFAVDKLLLEADGTENKQNYGANGILAVSIACCRALATMRKIPLYQALNEGGNYTLPVPMLNVLNGGAHAANSLDTQEFMLLPVGAQTFSQALEWSVKVFQTLKGVLKEQGMVTAVGDEGGFAPDLTGDEMALETLVESVERAGFSFEKQFYLGVDAASSEWKGKRKGEYLQPKSGKIFTSDGLIEHWKQLSLRFPLLSVEDGVEEEDWQGWKKLTKECGASLQLVGDDLFATNPRRIQKGISLQAANAVLIKPNQIGSVSETIQSILLAQKAGYATIVSHRSGETDDPFIADLSVAFGCGQIKTGAPNRGERVAKYNRLLKIEEQLGSQAHYAGREAFSQLR